MEWIFTEEAMRERKIRQCDGNASSLNYKKLIPEDTCDMTSCIVMGLDTPMYPARGSFAMDREGTYPFCTLKKKLLFPKIISM